MNHNYIHNPASMESTPDLSEFLNIFFQYILSECCNCISKECIVPGMDVYAPAVLQKYSYLQTNNQNSCNHIKVSEPHTSITTIEAVPLEEPNQINTKWIKYDKYPRLKCVRTILHFFLYYKLLTQDSKGNLYLLGNNRRFTWKNIKDIDTIITTKFYRNNDELCNQIYTFFTGKSDPPIDELAVHLKYLFWFLRKAIVDSIIIAILLQTKATKGLSVGSTKLSSDYDITLYSNDYDEVSKTIKTFNAIFKLYICNDPADTFDTNVYGVSFIKLFDSTEPTENSYFTTNPLECSNTLFTYAQPKTIDRIVHFDLIITQHIWAFVKLFMKISDVKSTNEKLYDIILSQIAKQASLSNTLTQIINVARLLQSKYEANNNAYTKSLLYMKQSSNRHMTPTEFNSFISFVNFNGSETYFTRGAFLDVVVNQQMCGSNKINLSSDEYLDSFIENMADLVLHFDKQKYLLRAQHALYNLKQKTDDSSLNHITTIFQICNQTNPLQCTPFLFTYECIRTLLIISSSYLQQYDTDINKVENSINQFEQFIERPIRAVESASQFTTSQINFDTAS